MAALFSVHRGIGCFPLKDRMVQVCLEEGKGEGIMAVFAVPFCIVAGKAG